MVFLFIGSAFWFVGDIQVNGNVTLAGSVLTNCRAFGFWIQLLLGVCLFSAVLGIRSYMLFHVFRLNMSPRGWRFCVPIIVYFACLVIFGILSLTLNTNDTAKYDPALDVCNSDTPLKKAVFVFAWLSIISIIVLTWLIRNIKSSFDESREMAFACVIMLASILFNTIVQFTHPHYALSRGYRIAATVFDHVTANAVWWALMAWPLFNCMFRRETYLRKWVAQLQQDGLQHQYQLENEQSLPLDQPLSHANLQYSSHIAYSVNNAGVRLWTPQKDGGMQEIRSMQSEGKHSLQRRFAHALGTLTLGKKRSPLHIDPYQERSRTVSWQPSTILHDDDSFRLTSSHSKRAL
ncbi:hypothetical protein IW140_005353 [Coemansia sp. RSA 1813]|nr:hypothetical protein EV178_005148 [Coemansia sp. RSA 1646]KAJ2086877.1 hypothetical protein IW138_005351 [Coemansia sp. RSA 986]KAJ2211685.1 hypothetical protein EV179_005301 [Coemansia sp. RSA 487]KAJ2565361.1 hypothetical protein IW140_005353 [Coemansia sp. RSA 1813]